MPQLDCSAVGYGFAKPKQSSTSVENHIVSLLKEDFETEKCCCVPLGPHFAVGTCPQCHRGVLSLGELCAKAAIKGPLHLPPRLVPGYRTQQDASHSEGNANELRMMYVRLCKYVYNMY